MDWLAGIEKILENFERIKNEEMRLTDLLVAFIDPNAEIDPNPVQSGSAAEAQRAENGEEEEEEEKPEDTGPDMDEAKDRFKVMKKLHMRHGKALNTHGYDSKQARKIQAELIEGLMEIKFVPKVVEMLWESIRVNVEIIRGHEKAIMDIAVNQAGISRKDFIDLFVGSETDDGLYKKLLKSAKKESLWKMC